MITNPKRVFNAVSSEWRLIAIAIFDLHLHPVAYPDKDVYACFFLIGLGDDFHNPTGSQRTVSRIFLRTSDIGSTELLLNMIYAQCKYRYRYSP